MNSDLLNYINSNFGSATVLVIVVAASIIAILRFGIQFDLNAYLQTRKKRHKALAQSACPHMGFEVSDKGIAYESWFVSPCGTTNWVCKNCGEVRYNPPSEDKTESRARNYVDNPEEYGKAMKRYARHAKKAI